MLIFNRSKCYDVWSGLQPRIANVDAAVSEWKKRLQACARANGGHFEKSAVGCFDNVMKL